MGKEFRIECKFCLKPIMVPIELCGKKIKCPACKNPVQVPRVKMQGAPDVEIKTEKKDIGQRAIQSRRKNEQVKKIIKYTVLAIIAYIGYTTYADLNNKNNKSIDALLAEYTENEDATTSFFITNNVTSEDLETIQAYAKASEEHVRIVVAKCLAKMQYSDDIYELIKYYLQQDTNDVKMAAAASCGTIEQIPILELLIDQLAEEQDKGVKGAIGGALRDLTGARGNTVNHQRWKMWWQEKRRNYQFPKIK